jgi:hypothetical protein
MLALEVSDGNDSRQRARACDLKPVIEDRDAHGAAGDRKCDCCVTARGKAVSFLWHCSMSNFRGPDNIGLRKWRRLRRRVRREAFGTQRPSAVFTGGAGPASSIVMPQTVADELSEPLGRSCSTHKQERTGRTRNHVFTGDPKMLGKQHVPPGDADWRDCI